MFYVYFIEQSSLNLTGGIVDEQWKMLVALPLAPGEQIRLFTFWGVQPEEDAT